MNRFEPEIQSAGEWVWYKVGGRENETSMGFRGRGGIAVGKADVCVRHTFDDAVDGQFGDSDQVIVSCWYLLKPSRVLDRGCC